MSLPHGALLWFSLYNCGISSLVIPTYFLHERPTQCSVRSKAMVLLLLIVTPIVEFCNCSMFCYALRYVHFSFAIILMGKRELVALRSLYSWCLVIVVWLFLAVSWACLQFVIVVFPDHTQYFCSKMKKLCSSNSIMQGIQGRNCQGLI